MTTFPLPTLAPTVDMNGISTPSYSDIFASLQQSYRNIFGQDTYLDPDSQDGQMLAIFALARKDSNDAAVAVYNSFSPATAQGDGLSSVVKVNGMTRDAASNSTADVVIVGVAGTIIESGVVTDEAGNRWDLPAQVIIPVGGQIDETVTAEQPGNITAPAGTINTIVNPVLGWQTVTNPLDAVPGDPVETDAELRRRQTVSTSWPAESPIDAIIGAVWEVPGVSAVRGYENYSDQTDQNGIPSHSIAVVVQGGDDLAIAMAIQLKKGPGCGLYGTSSELIFDQEGVPITIRWFRPTVVPVQVAVSIKALFQYVSTTGVSLSQAITDYVNSIGIGNAVYLTKLYSPANLYNAPLSSTYDLLSVAAAREPFTPAPSDIAIAFNELPTLDITDVILTVS